MLNRGLENIMHVQKTTQIGRKGTLLKLEFRLGSINLEDLSGPGIFFSFSLNSVNNRCLGVRGHSFHSSGRSALLPDVDENTDVLGLRCGHLRCGQRCGHRNARNLAHPTRSWWSSWLASLRWVKQPKPVFVFPSFLFFPPAIWGLCYILLPQWIGPWAWVVAM